MPIWATEISRLRLRSTASSTAGSTRPPATCASLGDSRRQRRRRRRRLFDVYLAFLEVELARRHSDLPRAQEATRGLEAALGAAAEIERAAGAARLPGTRAHQPRHRGAVGRPSRRRPAAPRGRPQPHAPDLTAVPRGRLPRASRDRGAAHRSAAAARAPAERAGARDRRGAWLDQPVDDDRRVRDGRHGARADGALRRSRAPSRSGGGDAPPGSRPGDRGHAPPCPRHAALRRGPVRRSPGGLRAGAGLAATARQRARVHRRRARPGSPGTGAHGRHRGCAARARWF